MRGYRREPLWIAYLAHRVSGILLALFLPVHFYTLSLALTRDGSLDAMLHFGETPVVVGGLVIMVFLLALHLFGGLRLLAIELLPWSPHQKTFAAAGVAAGFLAACAFLLRGI